jgi:hypothetical protein
MMATTKPPHGSWVVALEGGELWLHEGYDAGPEDQSLTLIRVDQAELWRRCPRLAAALRPSQERPLVLREP